MTATAAADSPGARRWPHVLAALVLAARCAGWAYHWFHQPQRYIEPIVGAIAWSAQTKLPDYAAPLALVVGFLAALVASTAVSTRIARAVGAAAAKRFEAVLLMASAPAAAWLSGLLTTRSESRALLTLSAAAVALVLFLGALLSLRPEPFWQRDEAQFTRVLGESLLALPSVWLAVSAGAVAASRLLALHHGPPLSALVVDRATVVAASVASACLIMLLLLAGTPGRAERALRRSLLLLQFAFPGFFFLLVPRPWQLGPRTTTIGYSVSASTWVLVAALIASSFATLALKAKSVNREVPDDPFALFSVTSIVGVLLFLKAAPVGLPFVPPDDYHFGEMLVPWWSLAQHHLVPFVDYSPARGLINYVPGAVAALFLDGKASSFSAAWPFAYLMALLVAVPAFRWSMSSGWAALALILAVPANGISEIDILVTVFVAMSCLRLEDRKPSRWIAAWILSGTALVLYAPGQGGLAVMATMPVGLWMAWRAFSKERRALLCSLAAIAAGAFALCALTPAGRMILGAIRYGLEQSSVNSVAHGVAWSFSFPSAEANPWLFEIMRASWLLVALWAGVLVVDAARARLAGERTPSVLPLALPVLLLTVLYILRAAGRIDPGPTRLGIASMWALSMLLPLLLYSTSPPGRRGGSVLAWVFLAGMVMPYFGGLPSSYVHTFEPIRNVPAPIANCSEAGPKELRLGVGFADPAHIARLSAGRAVLDRELDPGETYLDLSGRHAQYFYFDRRLPIETGAVYNLVAEAQQQRAIGALRRDPPPAVLVSADNIIHDGGPIGLRSPLLYRYVLGLRGYKVVVIRGEVWLLREDRISRLSAAEPQLACTVHEVNDATDNPLQIALQVRELGAIPAAWGRSSESLEGAMHLIRELPAGAPASMEDAEALGDGRYRVRGPHPQVGFDLSGWSLDGCNGGILSFDFKCSKAGPPPILELHWASAHNAEGGLTAVRFEGRDGHLMVPLDASPAWLLATRIRSLRFDIVGEGSCREFRIERIRLFQRHGAELASRPELSR